MRINYAHDLKSSIMSARSEKPMLSPTNITASPKRPINLSLTSKTVDMAKELGINLSQTLDALLNEEVKRRYWEKWRDDNHEAMLEYNERIAREGLPLAKYRTFGKSLGNGQSATNKSK
jgi:antitoxin CcdA